MAKQYQGWDIGLKAYDDMSSSQYYLVKMNGDDTADVCDGTTDIVFGVAQEGGTTGQGISVRYLGHSKVKFGDAVTAGDLVGTNGSGLAVTVTAGSDTTVYIAGRCVVGGSTNEIGEIVLIPAGRGQ